MTLTVGTLYFYYRGKGTFGDNSSKRQRSIYSNSGVRVAAELA